MNHFPLEFKHVDIKIVDQQCLKNISTTINSEGISIVMGTNGSGKTLFLKLCAGLIAPSSGTVCWRSTPKPPRLSFVPQKAVLLNLSVRNNLLLPLRYHKFTNAHERCQQALTWAGINHLTEQAAISLSTGEQQLVALARAWSLQPNILLLDEPSANLDPARQYSILSLLEELSQHCKLIISTHSITQARKLASDILLLDHGKLVTHQAADDFFQSKAFDAIFDEIKGNYGL